MTKSKGLGIWEKDKRVVEVVTGREGREERIGSDAAVEMMVIVMKVIKGLKGEGIKEEDGIIVGDREEAAAVTTLIWTTMKARNNASNQRRETVGTIKEALMKLIVKLSPCLLIHQERDGDDYQPRKQRPQRRQRQRRQR